MVLLLSKPAWFCGQAHLLSLVIINLKNLSRFFFTQQHLNGINYLITYFVPVLCPYHYPKLQHVKKKKKKKQEN